MEAVHALCRDPPGIIIVLRPTWNDLCEETDVLLEFSMCSDNDLTNFDKLRMNGRYSVGLRCVARPVEKKGKAVKKEIVSPFLYCWGPRDYFNLTLQMRH